MIVGELYDRGDFSQEPASDKQRQPSWQLRDQIHGSNGREAEGYEAHADRQGHA